MSLRKRATPRADRNWSRPTSFAPLEDRSLPRHERQFVCQASARRACYRGCPTAVPPVRTLRANPAERCQAGAISPLRSMRSGAVISSATSIVPCRSRRSPRTDRDLIGRARNDTPSSGLRCREPPRGRRNFSKSPCVPRLVLRWTRSASRCAIWASESPRGICSPPHSGCGAHRLRFVRGSAAVRPEAPNSSGPGLVRPLRHRGGWPSTSRKKFRAFGLSCKEPERCDVEHTLVRWRPSAAISL